MYLFLNDTGTFAKFFRIFIILLYGDIFFTQMQNCDICTNVCFAGMTLYLCMKAALTEPRLVEMSLNFHLATATWLSEIAINEDCKTFEPVKFPLPNSVPFALTCVPEFIMGNVTDFTLFLQRFKEDMYEVPVLILRLNT